MPAKSSYGRWTVFAPISRVLTLPSLEESGGVARGRIRDKVSAAKEFLDFLDVGGPAIVGQTLHKDSPISLLQDAVIQ